MYQKYIKTFFDFFFTLILVIILIPIFIIIGIVLKVTTNSSVIYKQKRVGKNGKTFNIYKFRTMVADTPIVVGSDRAHIRNRVTKVGRYLRDTSLDELPQLFNILKGNMSLIGPRPVVETEYKLLNLRNENDVLRLKPGLTGLAQVNGRKNLSDEKKAQFDAEYAKKISIFLDISILYKTIPVIFVREGVQKLLKKH